MIGQKVSVWWPEYGQHYSGTVAPTDDKRKGSYIVNYDDNQDVYEWMGDRIPKHRKSVEYELINDYKRIPKLIDFQENDALESDESDDEDYIDNSTSEDTDISDSNDG
jgi:hypothetical protein